MTGYGIPLQHEQTDRLLTTLIDTYHASFAEGIPFPWIELWAQNAEWTLPERRHEAGRISDWPKITIGSEFKERKFVEKRRIIQGYVAAWEGAWEAATTRPEQAAKLPLVMVIEFNQEGKVKSLYSYYDSAHFRSGGA
jgi:hypothetical protein